jgi:hypothetical protein
MFTKEQYAERDRLHRQAIDEMGLTPWEIIQDFPAFFRRREMARFLAHAELFQKVIDLPGCVLELGVFRGSSFFTWTKLMETFCPGDRSRRVYGFDSFEGLQDFVPEDGPTDSRVSKEFGSFKSNEARIRKLVEIHNQDNMVPGIERCEIITGNVLETLPKFLEEHPGLRISLLHLDMDLYKPTKFAMEMLYPLVVTGGVIAFDEYGLIPWEGESRAVDEYFKEMNLPAPRIQKLPYSPLPHGYMIKQ